MYGDISPLLYALPSPPPPEWGYSDLYLQSHSSPCITARGERWFLTCAAIANLTRFRGLICLPASLPPLFPPCLRSAFLPPSHSLISLHLPALTSRNSLRGQDPNVHPCAGLAGSRVAVSMRWGTRASTTSAQDCSAPSPIWWVVLETALYGLPNPA